MNADNFDEKTDSDHHYDHFKLIFYKAVGSVLQNSTMINYSLIFLIYQEELVSQEIEEQLALELK